MTVVMLQTADEHVYSEMIAVTGEVNRRYCDRMNIEYRSFLGLTRGMYPWHAALNRIDILYDMLTKGYRGWVIYLDADAWVQDHAFDINKYLSGKDDFAGIFIKSGVSNVSWDVNDGVFLINLGHAFGRSIVEEWRGRLDKCWHRICDSKDWPVGGPDDQSILHGILNDQRVTPYIFLESKSLINSNYASFIRQLLRSETSSFPQRLGLIREMTAGL